MTRSKVFLTVRGVEREQAVCQAKRLDQFWRGRNLVALLRDHQMPKHDLIGVPQRRHHMRGLAVAERIETAAQRFPVDGDHRQTVGSWWLRDRRSVAPKGGLQGRWFDAAQDQAQPCVGRRITQREAERIIEKLAMNADELVHLTVGVGSGDHRKDGVKQHGRQIEPLAFGATMVGNFTQNLQQWNLHATTSDSGCRL